MAKKTTRARRRLMVEVNAQALTDAGSSTEELLTLMQQLGYRLFRRSALSGGLREIEASGRHSALFDVHGLPD